MGLLSYLETIATYEGALAAITSLIAIVSVPVFLLSYLINSQRQKEAYDRAVHERLDTPYYQYLQYCIDHANLDIGEFPLTEPPKLDEIQLQKQRAVFGHLMSVFETAYLLYAKSSSKAKQTQWAGWDVYIESFCGRENFRKAWIEGRGLYSDEHQDAGSTLDRNFDRYMARKLSRHL